MFICTDHGAPSSQYSQEGVNEDCHAVLYVNIVRENERWRPILEAVARLFEESSRLAAFLDKDHENTEWIERLVPRELHRI